MRDFVRGVYQSPSGELSPTTVLVAREWRSVFQCRITTTLSLNSGFLI